MVQTKPEFQGNSGGETVGDLDSLLIQLENIVPEIIKEIDELKERISDLEYQLNK